MLCCVVLYCTLQFYYCGCDLSLNIDNGQGDGSTDELFDLGITDEGDLGRCGS